MSFVLKSLADNLSTKICDKRLVLLAHGISLLDLSRGRLRSWQTMRACTADLKRFLSIPSSKLEKALMSLWSERVLV